MAWIVLAILLGLAAAGLAAWRVAARQGRNPWPWALATVLLGGLPLAWLIHHRTFALPSFGSAVRHSCCDNQSWTAVADFGHAAGTDLDLGRCANCGAYLMAVFYVAATNYVVISDERAEHFLSLQGTPELKKALKNWVD